MTTQMTDKYETAAIDAATYRDSGKIDYRRKVQNEIEAEAAARAAKDDLAEAMESYDYDRQVAAEVNVRRTDLALAGAVNAVDVARSRIETLDNHMSTFVADVIGMHAYELGLHDANVVVMKYKPEGDDIPTAKTLVIAQHEATVLHGGGTMSGEAKMWTYGGASLDPIKAREVFGRYSDHYGGVEIGNWPGIFLKVKHAHAPEPIVLRPSAAGLAQIYANHGKSLNRRPNAVDAVQLWALVPADGEFAGTVDGTTVTVTGQVAVGSHSRVLGYTVGDLEEKMTDHIEHFGIGQFIAGIGILESAEVTNVALAEPGGVLLTFTATGRRKAPAAQ